MLVRNAVVWLTFVVVSFVAVGLAQAQEFECSKPDDYRYIRLEIPGQEHLCEVSVTHANNERKVMWYADHETLFCSAKIYELHEKYINKWGFGCVEWLDTTGIDKLSERHRKILDQELKSLIKNGQTTNPPYRISGIKAVTSSSLNLAPGALAFQYFIRDAGAAKLRDKTQIIMDDGSEWKSVITVGPLTEFVAVDEDDAITSALVDDISDSGVLVVNTLVTASNNGRLEQRCQGEQSLLVSENTLLPKSPHRVVCAE